MPTWISWWRKAAGCHNGTVAEAKVNLPALRDGYAAGAAVEDDAFDLDVNAIHQGISAAAPQPERECWRCAVGPGASTRTDRPHGGSRPRPVAVFQAGTVVTCRRGLGR